MEQEISCFNLNYTPHSMSWNKSDQIMVSSPSGVQFYDLRANGKSGFVSLTLINKSQSRDLISSDWNSINTNLVGSTTNNVKIKIKLIKIKK